MTTILTNRKEQTRFLKFMLVGAIGTLVDFGIMNLLKLVGMPLVWAGTISFICAILSNFIWNRYWTYPDSRSHPISNQLIMFFIINVAGLAIRLPILYFLELPMQKLLRALNLEICLTPEFLTTNFTLAIAVGVVIMFFIVNVAGLAIRLPILNFLELSMQKIFRALNLGIYLTPEFLATEFTLAVAIGVVMLWNFFANRYWTYNDVDKVK
jgi:putative flippase GtrA